MISRKITRDPSGAYRVTIPRDIAELMRLKPGEKVSFDIKDKKIIVTPITRSILQDGRVTGAEATTFRGGHID